MPSSAVLTVRQLSSATAHLVNWSQCCRTWQTKIFTCIVNFTCGFWTLESNVKQTIIHIKYSFSLPLHCWLPPYRLVYSFVLLHITIPSLFTTRTIMYSCFTMYVSFKNCHGSQRNCAIQLWMTLVYAALWIWYCRMAKVEKN